MLEEMILIAVAESIVLSALVLGTLKSRFGPRGACWVAGILMVGSNLLAAPIVAVQAILVFIVTLIGLVVRARPQTTVALFMGIILGTYALTVASSTSELNRLSQLRETYPLISVADRLHYEAKAEQPAGPSQTGGQASALSDEISRRLATQEERGVRNYRRFMLEALHDRTRDEFVMARGFGVVRMMRVRKEPIELPETAPVPLPPLPSEQQHDPSEYSSAESVAESEPFERRDSLRRDLLSMHDNGLEDFLEPERIGYVRDRDHVAGFQSHGFTRSPDFPSAQETSAEWKIVRLELVSLLKHSSPVAYVSGELPRMDKLNDAQIRPLNQFERDSLHRLRLEEDLVVDDRASGIEILGAIRAGTDCLKCHSVKRGELLGAFSYKLVRTQQAEKKELQVKGTNPPSI